MPARSRFDVLMDLSFTGLQWHKVALPPRCRLPAIIFSRVQRPWACRTTPRHIDRLGRNPVFAGLGACLQRVRCGTNAQSACNPERVADRRRLRATTADRHMPACRLRCGLCPCLSALSRPQPLTETVSMTDARANSPPPSPRLQTHQLQLRAHRRKVLRCRAPLRCLAPAIFATWGATPDTKGARCSGAGCSAPTTWPRSARRT